MYTKAQIEYTSFDASWSIDAWNKECMNAANDPDICFCCIPHFLCTRELTLELGTKHESHRNIVFCGKQSVDCLIKRHACTAYLDYYDWDLISWFAERYSDIFPPQSNECPSNRLSGEEFNSKYNKYEHTSLQLNEFDSLSDFHDILRRVISSKPRQSTRRGSIKQKSKPKTPNPPPSPKPPKQFPTWVFCTNRRWNRARLVEDFRPDPQYYLVRFYDGNLVRIRKEEWTKRGIVRIQTTPPTDTVNISNLQLVQRQIYIYMCLDGFWEFQPPIAAATGFAEASRFPYNNPADFYDPPYGRNFQDTEQAIVQMINSGKIVVPTDVEKGDELVAQLFSVELENRVQDDDVISCPDLSEEVSDQNSSDPSSDGYSSSSISSAASSSLEGSSASESDVNTTAKKKVKSSQKGKLPKDWQSDLFIGPLPFGLIKLEPGRRPFDLGKRDSGVKLIRWDAHAQRRCWHVNLKINSSNIDRRFKPRNESDEQLLDALNLAKECLLNELLPIQARWQLSQKPRLYYGFNRPLKKESRTV